MPEILQYLIISTLSVAMTVAVLAVGYMFWRKKNSPRELADNPQQQPLTPQQSSCHESAYKLLPEVILILNSQYQITYLNLEAEKMLGSKLRSVMGKDYRNVLSLKSLKTDRALQETVDISKNGEERAQEYTLQIKGNQGFPVKLSLIPIVLQNNEGVDESFSLLLLKNISGQKMLETQLSMIDTKDALTGILNRKSFENETKQLIDSAYKNNSSHVLAFFSIDKHREINDRFGHAGSENIIKEITGIINNNVVENLDTIARVGESDFCIIFTNRRLAAAIKAMESILSDVSEQEFMTSGHQYPVSMSAGFVVVDNESTSPLRLMSEANRACNYANKKGISRPLSYQANAKEIKSQEGNVEWVQILKKAIQENRFEMYAQPIHPLSPVEYNKPFSHYELLIRLDDEKGNCISPDEFISAAEYYLMMPSIDRWVIQYAFKKISDIPRQQPIPVFAINLSGQSLNDPAFLEFIIRELKSSSVNPEMLCFEITEQVAVSDITLLNKFISTLKTLGCTFSLDDFGTGASTYEYLRSLNVDYLKIDGSFVKNIATDEISRSMVESATQIGHTMNLKIIAEYVENTEILNILGDMGIDYGQGYHISRPGPLSAVIKRHQAVKRAINH